MERPVSQGIWGTEERLRTIVGFMALVFVPPLLMLVVLAAKFQGLWAVGAVDHAQLARHVAAGEGFVTSLIRPLSLVFVADLQHCPDLYNAPAHPLLLGLAYSLIHASDKVTAVVGGGLWIVSVWLAFWVARQWFGTGIAFLAALFYGCNAAAITAAVGGLPQPLMALSVLLVVGLVFPKRQDQDPDSSNEVSLAHDDFLYEGSLTRDDLLYDDSDFPDEKKFSSDLPGWRVGLAGLACALATLTGYLLVVVALALGLYLGISQHRKGRALAWFTLGFLLPLGPWMWRNFCLVGSPFFSLFWYELLSATAIYPGESLWRTATLPPSPLLFLLQHPVEILRKVFFGLEQFWGAAPTLVNPVIGLLFLMAWLNETDSPRRRELFAVVTGSLGLGVVGSCLFRSEPGFLLAWEPLFAILGAAYVSARLGRRFEQVEAGSRIWKTGAYVIVIALVSFPLGFLMLMSRSEPGDQERGEYLSYLLPPEATVMTDQPAFVAWYADRRAVWLCQRKEDWEALERLGGPVDATYVTSAITRMAANEQGDWWVWLVSPRGPYRRLVSVPSLSSNAVLRVRPEGRSQQGPPRPHGIRPPENAK